MAIATHRIRRQRWLCTAGSTAEAFALRGRLREAQEAAVPAAFARAFDAAVPGGEVVHLPRLELRIRLASVDDLATLLPDLLARAVSEELGRLLVPAARSQSPIPALPAPAAARRSGRESRLEALVIYLITGALPWELAQAEISALLEQLRETAGEELVSVLAHAPDAQVSLSQRQAFFFRLLSLLPEERWQEIAWHLSSRLPLARAVALGRALAALAELAPEVRRRVAALALGVAGRGSAGTLAASLAEALAEVLAGVAPSGLLARLAAFFEAHLAPAAGSLCRDAPWGVSEAAASASQSPTPRGNAVAGGNKDTAAETPHGASLQWGRSVMPFDPEGVEGPSSPFSSPASAVPIPLAEATAEAFPLAVRCAGLVLLHPFLPRLFESVGLLRDGDVPWTELPRAAALLHWLATGRHEAHEFEIGFIKVLLGRRPEEPLLVDGDRLTAADREEGEALLQAAIQHWRALKGTTPAGLRASFLQRGGLLREDDAGWRLHVEPAAFDLLLDHLPWGIGVIKLPWTTRPIFIEWPTP